MNATMRQYQAKKYTACIRSHLVLQRSASVPHNQLHIAHAKLRAAAGNPFAEHREQLLFSCVERVGGDNQS